jgi:hypothetical protein
LAGGGNDAHIIHDLRELGLFQVGGATAGESCPDGKTQNESGVNFHGLQGLSFASPILLMG